VTWVGHGFGGQVLGLVDVASIEKVLLVSTGHGYWRHDPTPLRRRAQLSRWLVLPAVLGLVRVGGHHPELPVGVVRQLRRWRLHPGYWAADVPDIRQRHARVQAPAVVVHATDDEAVTTSGARALLAQLGSRGNRLVELDPGQVGVARLGHHGLFRREHESLWHAHLVPELATTGSVLRPAVAA
jgi:predicted alpha/beta hydrolase